MYLREEEKIIKIFLILPFIPKRNPKLVIAGY